MKISMNAANLCQLLHGIRATQFSRLLAPLHGLDVCANRRRTVILHEFAICFVHLRRKWGTERHTSDRACMDGYEAMHVVQIEDRIKPTATYSKDAPIQSRPFWRRDKTSKWPHSNLKRHGRKKNSVKQLKQKKNANAKKKKKCAGNKKYILNISNCFRCATCSASDRIVIGDRDIVRRQHIAEECGAFPQLERFDHILMI